MSLSDAILEIAKEMEASACDSPDKTPLTWPTVRAWAVALRAVVKAVPQNPILTIDKLLADEAEKAEKVKIESVREARLKRLAGDEINGLRMVICSGGRSDGDYITILREMPEMAYMEIAGQVYQLKSNKMIYVRDEVEAKP